MSYQSVDSAHPMAAATRAPRTPRCARDRTSSPDSFALESAVPSSAAGLASRTAPANACGARDCKNVWIRMERRGGRSACASTTIENRRVGENRKHFFLYQVLENRQLGEN